MNPRSTPRGIFAHHPSDECSNLGTDFRPAQALWPGPKTPKQTKASPLPRNNSFWFNDDQDVAPCRAKPTEQNPKDSILGSQLRSRNLSLHYAQLLTEGKDLEAEVVAGTEESAEAGEKADEQ